jgi:hypothetical protein
MHVHYNNTIINILRFAETHKLTCYRPTMKLFRPGSFQMPLRSRMTSYVRIVVYVREQARPRGHLKAPQLIHSIVGR